jgi:exopolysaccharide biosynthesis polyprenyl glycosylphosphotransferase
LSHPDVAVDVYAGEAIERPTQVVAHRHRGRSYWLRRLLLAGDLLSVSLALLIALVVVGDRHLFVDWAWSLFLLPGMALLMRAYGLYDRRIRRISHSILDDLPPLFHLLVIGGIGLWLYYRYLPPPRLAYPELVSFGAMSAVLVLSTRALAFRVLARQMGPERIVFLGVESTAAPALVSKLANQPGYRLQPLGVISANGAAPEVHSLPVLGHLGDPNLASLLDHLDVDRVIVGQLDAEDRPRVAELLRQRQKHGLEVSVLPQLFDLVGPSAELDQIEGLTMLTVHPPVLSRSSRTLKRGLDLVGSSLALILLAPLLVVVAIMVKLDSPGPVLFRQTRIGKQGRRFTLLKFRTMVKDAEFQTLRLMAGSKDSNWLYLEDDPRITRLGRLLRRTSLDELPQLWNVVRGEMSLVGPRPLSEDDDRSVKGWGRARLDLVPGLTGLWQVLGRTNIPFEEMVKLDTVYVTNWSLWGDLKLIAQTLPALLSGRGSN